MLPQWPPSKPATSERIRECGKILAEAIAGRNPISFIRAGCHASMQETLEVESPSVFYFHSLSLAVHCWVSSTSLRLSSPWHKSKNYFCVKDQQSIHMINFICETCHPEKDSILCDSLRDKSLSDGEHNVRKRHLYEFLWWCGIFLGIPVKWGIWERRNYNL